jgi:hypothetical protein
MPDIILSIVMCVGGITRTAQAWFAGHKIVLDKIGDISHVTTRIIVGRERADGRIRVGDQHLQPCSRHHKSHGSKSIPTAAIAVERFDLHIPHAGSWRGKILRIFIVRAARPLGQCVGFQDGERSAIGRDGNRASP